MTKVFKDNYLSIQNGCTMIETSSERENTPSSNILTENIKNLWYIDEPLPQYCIINCSAMRSYPKVFNRVGFLCWHDYESNPQLIEISYCNRLDGEWTVAGKIRLSLVDQKQYFKIKEIPVSQMKYLKITILKNFGDKNTYLNQVQLGYVKEAQAQSGREKTFSQYVKLTSTQRELKRAMEQIKIMKSQQEQLKNTVSKQNELMYKMQEEIKLLTKHQERFNKMQELQNNRIQILQQGPGQKKEKSKIYTPGLVESSDQQKNIHKAYIEEALLQKKTLPVGKVNKSLSYTKSNKQSIVKTKQLDDYLNLNKKSKINTILKSRQAVVNDTDPNLSQYDSSDNDRSRHSQKCTELVFKLQRLLAQKDRRIKENNARRSEYRDK